MAIGTNDRGMALQTPTHRTGYSALDYIALVLMVVGGINWGLVGLFQLDLVAALLGAMTMPARVVYVLVGLAALYGILLLFRKPRD